MSSSDVARTPAPKAVRRRHVRLRGVAAAVVTTVAVVRVGGAQERPLDDEMRPALAQHGIPGASWAIAHRDRIETGAAGVRDVRTGAPLDTAHRVHVGSVTKTVIAVAVLRLVTLGRIDVDAPVRRYLPELPLDDPWERTHPVRVRHLLDHTAGLADARLWQVFTTRGDPDAPLADQLVRRGTRLRVRREPGTQFLYSNVGYTILGLLIERVTRERYERWIDREVLRPIGMTRSTMTWTSQVGRDRDTSLAMGHFEGGVPHPAYAIPMRPATQFTTTPADMGRFIRFLTSDGTVDGRVLVDGALLRAMGAATTTDAHSAGLTGGYGLGLVSRERWGRRWQCHLGNLGTFRAILCVDHAQREGFFVSYTSDPEALAWDRLDSLVAVRLGTGTEPVAAAAPLAVDAGAWPGWYRSPSRFQQFAYLDLVGAVAHAGWDGRTLRLAPLGGVARELVPVGGRLLRQAGRHGATHVLLGDGAARHISDGQRTFEATSLATLVAAWGSAAIGALAVLSLLVGGIARIARPRWRPALRHAPVRWAVASLGLCAAAPLLFLGQPFLAIGDATFASVSVAIVTTLLPVAVGVSLAGTFRHWRRLPRAWRRFDAVVLGGLAQWLAVLAWFGLVPFVSWW